MTALNYTDRNIQARYLGLCVFEDVEAIQMSLLVQVEASRQVIILGCEFEPVVTLGIRGNLSEDILKENREIPIVTTDRGGQATIHSPGQLIIYPMLDLKIWNLSVRQYVEIVLHAALRTLSRFGINAKVDLCNPGLYTEKGKIGFIGIKLLRGVVKHGLSINISNDVELFQTIRPCGQSQIGIDSIRNYNSTADLVAFFNLYTKDLKEKLLESVDFNTVCKTHLHSSGNQDIS